ncbi:MAG: T9SS type A sorting domain-containing protein [Ignavibacteriales bacterium]|nr:MAG: T9SS type A sorting domain-containing protein [Ignavibacteriales bacterium]
MMKHILRMLTLLLLAVLPLQAQTDDPPNWTVNPASFQFNASVIAVLKLNGQPAPAGVNILAAFAGEQVRGVATPIQVGNQQMYFLTVYANAAGEQLRFRAYIPSLDTVVFTTDSISFTPNGVYGSIDNPLQISAFFNFDRAPLLRGIPDQTVPFGSQFTNINLRSYLTEFDGDSVAFSSRGADNVQISISPAGIASVTPNSGWWGRDTVYFRATDVTSAGLFGEDTVIFQVLRPDNAPQLGVIPGQTIGSNSSFASFDLDDYLIETDGDSVIYNYEFTGQPAPVPAPDWTVNPAAFQSNMTMVIKVTSRGREVNSTGSRIAAFAGNQIRGVTQGITVGSSTMFFLTVYANSNGETIRFRVYDAAQQQIYSAGETVVFVSNASFGSPDNPYPVNAGNILVRIGAGNIVSFLTPDPLWSGSETIRFKVTDANTPAQLWDTSSAVYTKTADNTPLLSGIPDQTIYAGGAFTQFDFDNFLSESDGDSVIYTFRGQNQLTVQISGGSTVTVTPPNASWTGSEQIIFRAADNTANGLFSEDTVRFTVLPVDHPPVFGTIPSQTIGANSNFQSFNIRSYVQETDGDSLGFRYITLPQGAADPQPSWSVNPAAFQLTMTMIIEMNALGRNVTTSGGRIAAFSGQQVRGVASPINVGGKRLFFLTVYANNNGGQITFRYYDEVAQRELPVEQRVIFLQNASFGSPDQPYQMYAGYIKVHISQNNQTTVSLIERTKPFTERIRFYVNDINTLAQLGDSTETEFRTLQDNAPLVSGIPDQIISGGGSFSSFDLDTYLTEQDGDSVQWSVSGGNKISAQILAGNNVSFTVTDTLWSGTEHLIFRAADISQNGLFSQDTASFTVLKRDNRPVIGDIPDQVAGFQGSFNAFDLDSYLTEVDGDTVAWRYTILPPDSTDADPAWTINPASFELTMTMIARVTSSGMKKDSSLHTLAAWSGGQLRGVSRAIRVGSDWMYFMTIYSNTNNEPLYFTFYDADKQKIYPVRQRFNFSINGSVGTVDNPFQIDAGFIVLNINQNNVVSTIISDNNWSGSQSVRFFAQDVNTINRYTDSADVRFRVLANPILPISAPSGVRAAAQRRPLRIELQWNDNSANETHFVIQRKSGDSLTTSAYRAIDTVPANTVSYTDFTVNDTVVYTYRVYAYNSETSSPYSNQFQIRSLYTILPVAPPQSLAVFNASPLKTYLSWTDAANNETAYRVERKEGDSLSALPYNVIAQLPANASDYFDSTVSYASLYTYRVEAFNPDTASGYSNQASIVTLPERPSVPQLSLPADNAAGVTQPVTFKWRKSDRAVTYRFILSSDSLFTQIIRNDSTLTDTVYTMNGLQNLANYFWSVQAKNTGGVSDFSPVYRFRTIGLPSSVQLVQPQNMAVNVPVSNVQFRWTKAADILAKNRTILNYHFELTADTASAPMISDTTLTDTVYTAAQLAYYTNYYWRIQSRNEAGWSGFTPWNSFRTIIEAPASFALELPPDSAMVGNPVAFSWNNSQRAAGYILFVSASAQFTTTVIADTVSDTSAVKTLAIPILTTHYWKVKAFNDGGSAESAVRRFVLNTIPAQVSLLNPVNAAVNQPVALQLEWSLSQLALSYQLQVATDSLFTQLVVNDSTLTDTTKNISGLMHDRNYYWRVRGKNSIGLSVWSQVYRFRTIVPVPQSPVLVQPGNGAVNTPYSFFLRWRKPAYGVQFHLQIATDSAFTALYINDSTMTDTTRLLQNLEDGVRYIWRVAASNIAGKSDFSGVWSFSTRMKAPDSLRAAAVVPRKVLLKWLDRSSGEQEFVIERKQGGLTSADPFVPIASVPRNSTEYTDSITGTQLTWTYRVKAVNGDIQSVFSNAVTVDILTSTDNEIAIPERYELSQNYPNPFNPSTVLRYAVPFESEVRLLIYNALGETVAELVNITQTAGYYEAAFQARSLASGIYFYTLRAKSTDGKQEFVEVKKMILLK